MGNLFFYRPLHLFFFHEHEYEGIVFAVICAQNVTRFLYTASALFFLINTPLVQSDFSHQNSAVPLLRFQQFLADFKFHRIHIRLFHCGGLPSPHFWNALA